MVKSFDKILQYPDPKLLEKSVDLNSIDNDVKSLFKDLERLAKKGSKQGVTLVGLSAPQIGWNVRAFIFYDFKKNKYIEVINPKLLYSSKELSAEWEGCASVGTGSKSLFAPIRRSKSSQVEYLNLKGETEVLSATNYLSHILLHELDHLEGIIFLDRVEDPQMILTARELDEYAAKHGGNYPKIR